MMDDTSDKRPETSDSPADTQSGSATEPAEEATPHVLSAESQSKARKFSKVRNLEEKITALETERNDLRDRLLRALAEQENYRRRVERDREMLIRRANAGLLQQLLPIIDDLHRSVDPSHRAEEQSLAEGLLLIHQKIDRFLEQQGVIRIESLGQVFNTDEHEAVAQLEREGAPPGQVIEVFQDGYRLFDTVLRHAKVVVSK